jgi:hypothetical protein
MQRRTTARIYKGRRKKSEMLNAANEQNDDFSVQDEPEEELSVDEQYDNEEI